MKDVYRDASSFHKSVDKGFFEYAKEGSDSGFFTTDSLDEAVARSVVKGGVYPRSETLDYLSGREYQSNLAKASKDAEDAYLKISDRAVDEQAEEAPPEGSASTEAQFTYHRCKRSGEPYPVEALLTLSVDVQDKTKVTGQKKECQGHHYYNKFRSKGGAKSKGRELKKGFSQTEDIDWYSVRRHGKSVNADWKHKDGSESCDHYEIKDIGESFTEERDRWIWSGVSEEEASNLSYRLIAEEALDGGYSKNINGRSVYRDCWKKRLVFLFSPEQVDECSNLKMRGCALIEKKCLKRTPGGCSLWLNVYRCAKNRRGVVEAPSTSGLFGLDGSIDAPEEQANTSLAEVATTLSVFEAIHEELKDQQSDAGNAILFVGSSNKCTRNVAGNALYDCCYSMGGFSNDIRLSKCSSEERALAEKRRSGLCLEIGASKNKALGIKTSTTHTFVCFPTKLARIFQEQAREQLGISWGTADNPNLSGLTPEMIAKLDFNQMDFSELFADQLDAINPDMTERLLNYKPDLEDLRNKMEVRQ